VLIRVSEWMMIWSLGRREGSHRRVKAAHKLARLSSRACMSPCTTVVCVVCSFLCIFLCLLSYLYVTKKLHSLLAAN
jgi:TRAP-type C4-dicarboxylate transport system permease small subunit